MAKKSLTFAELKINLAANSVAYNRELQKANRKTRDWAAETRQHVNTAGKYIAGMSVAAGASLAVIYKSAAEANDKLAKMSDRLGISTEALGGYRHAAELTGVSQEKFDTSIERMVKRMGEAEMGFGAAKSMLDKYGLANEDFFNKGPEQQFETLADTMKGMTNATEQSAFAAAVFGREGIALVNTAKLGGDGIRELRDEAEQLGLTVSRVDAAKIEAANDAMTRAKSGFKGFANSLTVELAPLVEAVANMFTDATASSNGWRDEVINGVESVVMALGYVGNSVRGIEIAFTAAQLVVSAFALGALETFRQVESGWVELYNLVAPKSMEIDPKETIIAKVAHEANLRTVELKDELRDLAMEPLPSDKIKAFFDDVRTNANSAAETVAKAAKVQANPAVTMSFKQDPEAVKAMYDVEKYSMDSYDRQQLAATENFAKHQDLLYQAKEKELITQEQFEVRSTQLAKVYADQRTQIEEQQRQVHINGSKQFFADLATLSDHGHKTLAAIGKWAARMNITISTIESAQHAYKWASSWGGPAAGATAASAAVIAGAMRLRQLEQAGSGSSGGLSGGTTFDQSLPAAQDTALSPTEDSASRGGQVVIQQSIEIKALDGSSVQQIVENNREIFLQPVYEEIEERGGLY